MSETVHLVPDVPDHEEACAAWVRPHVPAMARLAARLAGGADRDDIVQEALARAWVKRRQFDGAKGAPSAWLLAITADQARKAVRRLGRIAAHVERPEQAPDVDGG